MRIVPYMALLKRRMIGPTPAASAVASSCPVIRKPPSPQNPTTSRSGWTSLAATAAGTPRPHPPAARPERGPRRGVLKKAVGPAAKIPGVAGNDRVVGQATAHPPHAPAEIERGAGRHGDDPCLVVAPQRGPP